MLSALIPRASWSAPVWRWSVMWGITVGMIITGLRALWSTPVVVSIISMMWPGASSVRIVVTVAAISVETGLRSWSAVSVSVLVTVVRGWSSAVPGIGFWPVVSCGCTRGWHLMWTVHYNMPIFITFKAMYIWAVESYMSWFLTLEASILFMGQNIYCWWW